MKNLVLRDKDGKIKGSIRTHHTDQLYLRDLVGENLRPGGVFRSFGEHGDKITVESDFVQLLGENIPKCFEKLSEGAYLSAPEASVTVTVYRIVDDSVATELEEIAERDGHAEVTARVLDALALFDEGGYDVPPGATYHTYDVERVGHDLLIVQDTLAANI